MSINRIYATALASLGLAATMVGTVDAQPYRHKAPARARVVQDAAKRQCWHPFRAHHVRCRPADRIRVRLHPYGRD